MYLQGKEREVIKMYYMLVKVTGDSKKYFIKSKYPIRNRQLMLNEMSSKYDVWDKDSLTGKPLSFFQYYLGIIFNKII